MRADAGAGVWAEVLVPECCDENRGRLFAEAPVHTRVQGEAVT